MGDVRGPTVPYRRFVPSESWKARSMADDVRRTWKRPPHPFVYEINTWPWLHELSEAAGRPIDLGSVPADHPWSADYPGRFIRGTVDDLAADPKSFVAVDGQVLANGRDPYFPAWPDVVQLNAFSADLRDAVVGTLRTIADQCDGVRCDMAML